MCTNNIMYAIGIHELMIAIASSSLYNDYRNSKEVTSMFCLAEDEKIGSYLKELIEKKDTKRMSIFVKHI